MRSVFAQRRSHDSPFEKLKARLLADPNVKAEYEALAPEWQVAGIKQATASVDRSEGVSHALVKDWVASWGSATEKPPPKRR